MDFHRLSRKELQVLCKNNKIPANITNVAMAEALKALQHVEGLDDLLNLKESNPQQFPGTPDTRTASRTSTRRKPIKEDSESSMLYTHPGCAETSEGIDQENKDLYVPATPAMLNTRRRAPADSSRRKKEGQMGEDEKNEGQKKKNTDLLATPAAPNSIRINGLIASNKLETPKEGTLVQRTYRTRRSVRLLEKNMSKMSLLDTGRTEEPVKVVEVSEEMSYGSERSDAPVDVKKGAGVQAESDKMDGLELEVTSQIKNTTYQCDSHSSNSKLALDSDLNNAADEVSEFTDESELHLNKTSENAGDVNNSAVDIGTEFSPDESKLESNNHSNVDVIAEFSVPSKNINLANKSESAFPETGVQDKSQDYECLNEAETNNSHGSSKDAVEENSVNLCSSDEQDVDPEDGNGVVDSKDSDKIVEPSCDRKHIDIILNTFMETPSGFQDILESQKVCFGKLETESESESKEFHFDFEDQLETDSTSDGISASPGFLVERNVTSPDNIVAGEMVSVKSAEEESPTIGSKNLEAIEEPQVDFEEIKEIAKESDATVAGDQVYMEESLNVENPAPDEENMNDVDVKALCPGVKYQPEALDEIDVIKKEVAIPIPTDGFPVEKDGASHVKSFAEILFQQFPADQLPSQFPRPTRLTPKEITGEKQAFIKICAENGDGEVEAVKDKANAYQTNELMKKSLRELNKELKKFALVPKDVKNNDVAKKKDLKKRIPLQENRMPAGEA
ncbi:Zinc finger, CCHC-type [Quillaja saponaria]|uniref:Zinc finger, CCHC-type n=1 Tax=Quillaja saponaria TaxID=32244 RepID=A0AAD7L1F8_QUISA|nr:Zinc finger, CCHC-type [Quillaja saponaria]